MELESTLTCPKCEHHNPPTEAMDPKKWKHWHDTVFRYGGPSTYIDYLIETGILKSL